MAADATLDPHLTLWSVPNGPMRAAADDTGQLLVFSGEDHALLFAARLAVHGLQAVAWPTNAGQVVDLLLAAGVSAEDAPHRVSVFEAQTTDPADAERWCLELADRLVENVARPNPDDLS